MRTRRFALAATTALFTMGFGVAAVAVFEGRARAQAAGECASGFCGTPNNNGGGGAAAAGGSILVNNTDIGITYSTSDDYDSDGFEDDFDNCLFVANRDQADGDGDKVGNVCDNCPNAANPDQRDTDGDRIGDACDDDIDNDGRANGADNCPVVPNLSQGDVDGDASGDACDADIDNDGVANRQDNCPYVSNPGQERDVSGTSGSACDNDTDKDGVLDSSDNCVAAGNPEQTDSDNDGFGDACDLDSDADGVPNTLDNCPSKANPDQVDADRDGLGDVCDVGGFCFVAGKNRAANCLDPNGVFQVTAAPKVKAKTGEKVFLSLYANRENAGIRYTWSVLSGPENDTVSNPRGAVHQSSLFEYRYSDDGKRPTFVPSAPGTYRIRLAAELESADKLFPGNVTAAHELELVVEGEPQTGGGCQAGSGARASGLGMMVMVGLAGLVARRRRKR